MSCPTRHASTGVLHGARDRPGRGGDVQSINEKQRKEWGAGAPESWVNEAHRVAVEKVYTVVAEGGDPPKLSREYVTKSTPVVAEQIKRAGVRLATVVNSALR